MREFAKGKRGVIYITKLKGIRVCVKKKNPKSEAVGNLLNEYNVLRFLNKKKLPVPKVIKFDGGVYYYFIPGKLLKEYVEDATREQLLNIILDVAEICHKLDTFKINKEEMHHPWKHVIICDKNYKIYKKGVYLVDFERARWTERPKNVTQFLQFLATGLYPYLLENNIFYEKEKIRRLSMRYKADMAIKPIMKYLNMETFEQKVWYETTRIPLGSTSTYKEIAERIGKPKAYRAVGNALNRNPFSPIVPCHRVIRSDGTIGGFSQGTKKKREMLRKESL